MTKAFDFCARLVLAEEGGLVDHALDPGGRTNLGITHATLAQARVHMPSLPARVDHLTNAQALAIYERLYWTPIRGDELPLSVALVLFDGAVNQGTHTAARLLQLAVGATADGEIGPKTLAAVRSRGERPTLAELGARRMHAYMMLDRLDDAFGLGWSRRLVRVLLAAQAAIRVAP